MHILRFILLLAFWSSAAFASDIQLTSASGDQATPSIARLGDSFLIVWSDFRNEISTGSDIYASRYNSVTQALDFGGFPICGAVENQSAPCVAAGETEFLVVWQSDILAEGDIYAARFAPQGDGVVLDSTPIAVAAVTGNQKLPCVAYDGVNYVVAWMDNRDYATTLWDVYLRRVNKFGTLVGSSDIKLTGADDQDDITIACGNNKTLVVYRETALGNISGILLNNDDSIYKTTFDISTATNTQKAPCVAYGGDVFLVAWEDYRNSATNPDIYCTRVSKWGEVLDSAGVAISTDINTAAMRPSVTYDGLQFIVSWESNTDIASARVVAEIDAITVRDNPALVVTNASVTQSDVCLAAKADIVLNAWADDRLDPTGETEIYYNANAAFDDVPVIVTDTPLSAKGGARVMLWAEDSYDPEGGSLSGVWRQSSGASVTLKNEGALSCSFVAPSVNGLLEFEVEISDRLNSTSKTVSVNITDAATAPPVVLTNGVTGVGAYEATLEVTTDTAAKVYCYWGLSPALEFTKVSAASSSHSILLSGLVAGGSYAGRFFCVSADGATTDAVTFSFTTTDVPGGDDADGDGLPDNWEKELFGDLSMSATSDVDGDDLILVDEYRLGTNPFSSDTDGDSYSDGWEVTNGYDPLAPSYIPRNDNSGYGCGVNFYKSFSIYPILLIIALLLRISVARNC